MTHPASSLHVEQNTNPLVLGGGGFYVVERIEAPWDASGYVDISRGWTYRTREDAERTLPLVAAGIEYPTREQLAEVGVVV